MKEFLLKEKLIFDSGFEKSLFKKTPKILKVVFAILELIPLALLTIMFFIFAGIVTGTEMSKQRTFFSNLHLNTPKQASLGLYLD